MSPVPVDDEFWRRHDPLIGVTPAATEITNRIPIIDASTVPPADAAVADQPEIDIAALEHEVHETVQRAAEGEQRAAERDAALRAVVVTFEQQLADMEAEHARRLETIRLGAESTAERILAEARERAAALLAEAEASRRGVTEDGI